MKKPSGVRTAFVVLLFMSFFKTGAQGLFQVPINEKISHSSLIVEGKVVAQAGFWNEQHTMIFTSNKIEVYKIFKGSAQKNFINVTTVGGSVDNQFMSASHLLKLEKDDIGVFFCRRDKHGPVFPNAGEKGYEVYSSAQGFFKYDHDLQTANAPFVHYKNIQQQLYKELKTKTGKSFGIVNRLFSVAANSGERDRVNISSQVLAPSITSFSPSTVNAGALLDPPNNELTIAGTGFGASPAASAAVFFDNPDDGPGGSFTGVAYNSPLIVSWSDVQIKVKVPSKSGTGVILVRDNAGNTVSSGTSLTVRYSVLDASFIIGGNEIVKEIRLINSNGLGGYSVLYSNNTANNGINLDANGAKATFQRALTTWKENSGFNVTEGGTDTQQRVDPYDSTNMIMFDNSCPGNSPLPAGVLAVCFSSGSFCPDNIAGNQAYKPGFDIVIRNDAVSIGSPVSFTYGPCSPYTNNTTDVDLETVLFHELGHAINMGHINDARQGTTAGNTNPAKVMNYALSRGLKRISEDYSSRTGASYLITAKGISLGSCAPVSEMTPLAKIAEPKDECPSSFPVASTPPNTTVSFDLVHASSNKMVDPDYTQSTMDGTGKAITNTAYYAFRTNAAGGNLSLAVSGYNTVPASAASCSQGPPAIPVTGIQLSVYQVSACPTAQTFPTPVAYTSFQADGIIPSINGLAPNTNYLMMFNGVENTKAFFNITFSGSALPLRITEFTGKALTGENRIWWKATLADQASTMRLEKSADGISFTTLSGAVTAEQIFNDADPLIGNNYYRLAVVSGDGAVQYSRVILLDNREGYKIKAFPNPAGQVLNLSICQNNHGCYSILLRNTLGQSVLEKRIFINENNHVEKLAVGALTPGVYYISVFGPKGLPTKSLTITLK